MNFNEEIFKPEFDLAGPHLVAASAGTGKTYNIQNIYARLVMEKGYRVSQIQVMTYTEAATKELRARVRSVLASLAKLFAGETGDIPADELERLKRLRECARANIGGESPDAAARARVGVALMEFDQASISTIHGFCRRALVRFAFETDSPFRTEFADTKPADLSRRARDWWRRERDVLPETVKADLELPVLEKFVQSLGGKAGCIPAAGEAGDAEAFALARAKEIVDAYEDDRSVRDTLTFDDLLRGLGKALQNPGKGKALAALLREEFKAALVDEFQDTDPVQYDIFRRVFLDPEADPRPALFFVGDPKQAIYSFRGGDIYTYKKAVTDPAVAANAFRLGRNFRSTPRLIDAVNALFLDEKRPDGSIARRTFGDDSIDYPDPLSSSGKPALTLPDGRDDPSPFRIVLTGNPDERKQAVVDAVLNLLKEQRGRGLTPRDIAILVTSHDAGSGYRDSLRAAGVPAVLQKAGNVFAGNLAADFRQVLMAMAMTGGRGQVKSALLTNFFSFGEEERLDDSVLADLIGFFGELNQTWQEKGFNAAFSALEAHPRCNVRLNLAKQPDGERLLADLMQILDLAGAAAREIGPSPDALVNWITERINQSDDGGSEKDADEYARQLESENDALKIMTIHASKGLEFPVVIVPVSKGIPVSAPYFYHDKNLDLRAGTSGEAAEKARIEGEAERMRLLYVAFTRATKRTIVATVPPDPDSPLGRLFENARRNGAGSDAPDSPILWSSYAAPETPLPPYCPETRRGLVLIEAKTPRAWPLLPVKGSYTSLSPAAHGSADGEHDFDGGMDRPVETEEPAGVFLLPAGAKTGTCWHAILEKLPFDASPARVRAETEDALKMYGLADADESVFKPRAELVAEMIEATLDYPLESPQGKPFTLREVSWNDRFSEWEFDFSSAGAVAGTASLAAILREEWADDPSKKLFLDTLEGWNRPIPKGCLKGFLDLLFRKDGFYYVVDWKSNRLDGRASAFDEPGVAAEMAKEGYFFQYLLYSVVLHRFLKERLGAKYAWERNFGGVRYYFLRGIAAGGTAPVFADRPSERLLDRLASALGLEG